jgi:integrase
VTRKYGTGSIYRDKVRGGWLAQVKTVDPLTGRTVTRRKRAKTRDGARDALDILLGSAPHRNAPGTVAEYLFDWTDRRLPNTALAQGTKDSYAQALRVVAAPAAGKLRMSELTPALAEQWLAAVAATKRRKDGKPLSPNTVRRIYASILKALDTAVADGLLETNPMRAVDRPKVIRPRVPVAGPEHTAAAIEATAHKRVGPLVVLIAYTGMRLGEALGLRWADVDLAAGTATIRRSAPGTDRTKTGAVRTVTLIPDAVEALRQVQARQRRERLAVGPGWSNPQGLVFTNATGGPVLPRNARHALKTALEGAGLESGRPFHAFRHGLATRLLQQGIPMPVVSAIVGHASISTTVDVYGHVNAAIPASVLEEALR